MLNNAKCFCHGPQVSLALAFLSFSLSPLLFSLSFSPVICVCVYFSSEVAPPVLSKFLLTTHL